VNKEIKILLLYFFSLFTLLCIFATTQNCVEKTDMHVEKVTLDLPVDQDICFCGKRESGKIVFTVLECPTVDKCIAENH